MLHLEEPLQRETWFDSCIRIALRITYLIGIVFHFLHQASFLQVFGNLLTTCKAIHSYIQRTLLRDCTVCIENVDGLQIMGLTQHIVVGVVCRSYLQASRTKFDVYISVFDDWNHAIYQWHNHLLTLQPLVLGVFGIDTHGCIAHDGFRASGSHYSIVALFVFVDYIF